MAVRYLLALSVTCLFVAPVAVGQQDNYFDSGDVRIRYVEQGRGEPVVLLHGQPSNLERQWISTGVLANLAKDHRVIAMDLRGYGKSDKPHDPELYGEQMGEDVVHLLDHLKIPRAHIVGYSMGCTVNGKLLITNPDRYLTAVFGGGGPRRTSTPQDLADAETDAAELTGGGPTPFRSFILRTAAPRGLPPPSEAELRQLNDQLLATNDPLAIAAFLRSRHRQLVTDAELSTVKVPVLAVLGSGDPAVGAVKELNKVMPQLTVRIIDGATHMGDQSALARPEFSDAIRSFIASRRAP